VCAKYFFCAHDEAGHLWGLARAKFDRVPEARVAAEFGP